MGRVGNTNRDVRKFLRESGVKANAANVERIGREVRRTSAENERVDAIGRELNLGTQDERGKVGERVKRAVAREMRRRGSG